MASSFSNFSHVSIHSQLSTSNPIERSTSTNSPDSVTLIRPNKFLSKEGSLNQRIKQTLQSTEHFNKKSSSLVNITDKKCKKTQNHSLQAYNKTRLDEKEFKLLSSLVQNSQYRKTTKNGTACIDWGKIKIHFPSRSDEFLRSQWHNRKEKNQHLELNDLKGIIPDHTREDVDKLLLHVIDQRFPNTKPKNWKEIAQKINAQLNTAYPPKYYLHRWQQYASQNFDKSPLKPEEERLLIKLIQDDRHMNHSKSTIPWTQIHKNHFPNRSPNFLKNCFTCIQHRINTEKLDSSESSNFFNKVRQKRKPLGTDLDKKIQEIINQLFPTSSPKKWQLIADELNEALGTHYTARHCNHRWVNYLSQDFDKTPLNSDEGLLLLQQTQKHTNSQTGNISWAAIQKKYFQNRSPQFLKNAFAGIKNKLSKLNSIPALTHSDDENILSNNIPSALSTPSEEISPPLVNPTKPLNVTDNKAGQEKIAFIPQAPRNNANPITSLDRLALLCSNEYLKIKENL